MKREEERDVKGKWREKPRPLRSSAVYAARCKVQSEVALMFNRTLTSLLKKRTTKMKKRRCDV